MPFAALAGGELHQHLGGAPFDIQIHGQSAVRNRVEKPGAEDPENVLRALGIQLGHGQAQVTKLCACCGIAFLHQAKNSLVHVPACRTIGCLGGHLAEVDLWPNPAPFNGPEVSRMDSIRTGQHLRIPVMRKKANRRFMGAAHDDVKVLQQGETRSFQKGRRRLGAALGTVYELLNGRFHGTKHVRGSDQSHHLQCTYRLVHVLARHAQLACVNRPQIGSTRRLGVPNVTFQRLVGDFQGLPKLVKNPSQRTQVRYTGNRTGPTDSVFNLHDLANSAS